MIAGVHVVKKPRKDRPPVWYVYAYRGGPQIHRCEGVQKPRLKDADVRRWIEASASRIEKVVKQPETLGELIALWQPSSPEWNALAATTRKTWGSALNVIDAKWGSTPLAVWNDPRMTAKVVSWRDSRADKPRAADMGVIVLYQLLKFGRLRGKVIRNAAEGIPRIYRAANRAEIIWTESDLAAFVAVCERLKVPHVADGLHLAALTGLRREDLVTLSWDEVESGSIVKIASKKSRGRRRKVIIPRYPALDALLETLKSRHRKEGVNTVLVNSYGQSWSGDGFGGSFNRVRDEAGIAFQDPETNEVRKKHLHDLRGTFCTKLIIEVQLSDQDVAEIMGWSPEQVRGIRRTYVDRGHVNMAIAARLRDSL